MHRLLIIIHKCRWKSYEIHCGIEALANSFNAVTSCCRHLSLNTASQTQTSVNLYCGLTFKDTHHERNIHSDSLLCSSSQGATPMPAINAVYSRNNLTMFSTSIVQASRWLPKQALNAVYSQLNHFRTSLTVMPLCWGAASLFFFLFLHYSLFVAFLFILFFMPINQTFYVDISSSNRWCSRRWNSCRSVVPCSPLRLADRWSCW